MNLDYKAEKLLDMFDDNIHDIEYVRRMIEMNRYTLLPSSVAVGNVYKIVYEGNIDALGYEKGFLYLPKGTGIKEHVHNTSAERYTLLCGEMNINGQSSLKDDCLLGGSHSVSVVDRDTIIKTLKVSDDLIVNADIYEPENKELKYII